VLELRERNLRTKIRKLSNGSTRGGVPFTQGPLFYLLRNRFYIGEVLYKSEICPGPQPPLIDRELFEAVQRRLTEQRTHHAIYLLDIRDEPGELDQLRLQERLFVAPVLFPLLCTSFWGEPYRKLSAAPPC
jgi:hypothetical protein